MSDKQADWLKGSLPNWIVVGLLTLLSYAAQKYIKHIEDEIDGHSASITRLLDEQAIRNSRIAILEEQNRFTRETINELKVGQREVISELRIINDHLHK